MTPAGSSLTGDFICEFCGMFVAVYVERSARQKHIDETRGLCIKAFVEIIVHMKSGTCLGLHGHFIE